MQLLKVARSYLRQASARLEDAKEAHPRGNHPYAVRLSQECVELSLKAALKAVAIEYPKVHDVSDILAEVKERFPQWFKTEIDYLCESSRILFKLREPSLYGGEEAFMSPDEVISKDDAADAVSRAEKTYNFCEKLIAELSSR